MDTSIKPGTDSFGTFGQALLDKTDTMEKALWYLTTAMRTALHNLLENSPLYFLKENELEDWPEVTKRNVKKDILLLIFWEVPSSIKGPLAVGRPRAPTLQVDELEEEGTALMRIVEASPICTIVRQMFHHGSVLFFQHISSFSSVSITRDHFPSVNAIFSTKKKTQNCFSSTCRS